MILGGVTWSLRGGEQAQKICLSCGWGTSPWRQGRLLGRGQLSSSSLHECIYQRLKKSGWETILQWNLVRPNLVENAWFIAVICVWSQPVLSTRRIPVNQAWLKRSDHQYLQIEFHLRVKLKFVFRVLVRLTRFDSQVLYSRQNRLLHLVLSKNGACFLFCPTLGCCDKKNTFPWHLSTNDNDFWRLSSQHRLLFTSFIFAGAQNSECSFYVVQTRNLRFPWNSFQKAQQSFWVISLFIPGLWKNFGDDIKKRKKRERRLIKNWRHPEGENTCWSCTLRTEFESKSTFTILRHSRAANQAFVSRVIFCLCQSFWNVKLSRIRLGWKICRLPREWTISFFLFSTWVLCLHIIQWTADSFEPLTCRVESQSQSKCFVAAFSSCFSILSWMRLKILTVLIKFFKAFFGFVFQISFSKQSSETFQILCFISSDQNKTRIGHTQQGSVLENEQMKNPSRCLAVHFTKGLDFILDTT